MYSDDQLASHEGTVLIHSHPIYECANERLILDEMLSEIAQ